MNNNVLGLESLINWSNKLPNQVLKFNPTAVYFSERPMMWNSELCAKLFFANNQVFHDSGYISIGDIRSETFNQSIVTAEKLDDLLSVSMFVADNYQHDAPAILSNASMDWCAYDDLSEEHIIIVFRCDEVKIKEFLDYLNDVCLFDWGVLTRIISQYPTGSPEVWNEYKSIASVSPAHKNVFSGSL